jgi:hypothetical protein
MAMKLNKKVFAINQAIETCIAAALFDYRESTIAEVEEIIKRSNEYMKESEPYLIKYKEDWIMEINKIKPEVKKECLKLLDKNISGQNEAVKELKLKFKDVPNKDLANIFKESKEEWMKPKEAREKNEAKNQPISEQKEVTNAITPKEENKSIEKQIDKQKQDIKSIFDVVEKKLKFKGEFYNYEKDKSGLKVGAEFFKSLEEIEAFRIRETEEFEKMVEEIRQAFAYEG